MHSHLLITWAAFLLDETRTSDTIAYGKTGHGTLHFIERHFDSAFIVSGYLPGDDMSVH